MRTSPATPTLTAGSAPRGAGLDRARTEAALQGAKRLPAAAVADLEAAFAALPVGRITGVLAAAGGPA